MKRLRKTYRPVAILFLMVFYLYPLTGQTVTVSTIVKPPYKPLLDRLPEQVSAVITTTGVVYNASLSVTIRGDNGITISSAARYFPRDINLTPRMPLTITAGDLYNYFNAANLVSAGIPMQEVVANGLPEGSYQICIRVRSSEGTYLSAEEPMGCSNYFSIRYSDPPMPINPQCGATLNNSIVQNIMFTWTPPTSAPVFTSYTLRMVELLDSTQNPNAAMLSAGEPVFFETTVYGTFSFHYGPSQPRLEKGKIYAWQIIAEDGETKTKFANNGRSEVCWFKWLPIEISLSPSIPEVAVAPRKDFKTSVRPELTQTSYPNTVPVSVISGKLNYKFKGGMQTPELSITNPSVQVANNQPTFQQRENKLVKQENELQFSLNDGMNYNKNLISSSNSEPLANVRVSLVVCYYLKGTINNGQYSEGIFEDSDLRDEYFSSFQQDYPDNGRVLATTTTRSDGSFTFTFINTIENQGLVDGKLQWKSGGGEFYGQLNGMLYKVLRIKVEDQYYCSPDMNIKVDSWESLDLGTVVSYVKSYNLKVQTRTTNAKFWDVIGGSNSPVTHIKTSVLRKTLVSSVPANEGGASSNNPVFPRKLSTGYSDGDGNIIFTNLVQHDPDKLNDKYYILCEPEKNQGRYIFNEKEEAYYPFSIDEKRNFPYNGLGYYTPASGLHVTESYGSSITWNSELEIKTFDMIMHLYPGVPRVYGKVETSDVNAKPFSNIKVVMLNTYHTDTEYAEPILTATTDANGLFEFDRLDPEVGPYNPDGATEIVGPDRTIFCWGLDGFRADGFTIGILKWGQEVEHDFIAEPDGQFMGYVTDEQGNPVAASVQIDDLAFSATQPIYSLGSTHAGNESMNLPNNQNTIDIPGNQQQVINLPANQTNIQSIPAGISPAGTGGNKPVLATSNPLPAVSATGGTNHMAITESNRPEFSSQSPHNISISGQFFSFPAPSGKDRTLTIQPKDPGFSSETYTVEVPKSSKADEAGAQTYIVYKMKKRIRFRVFEKPSGMFYNPANLNSIPNVKVTLDLPGNSLTQVSDARGTVVFEFENNGSSFTFTVEPPEDADYESTSYTLNNVGNTKSEVTYDPVLLRKATRISGKVHINDTQTPLPGATVYIEKGNGERIEAITEQDGAYTLRHVPREPNMVKVWASKPNAVPNIISQSKYIILDNDNTLSFTLKNDSSIVIPDIYGFEVDIQDKKRQLDGSYLISGSLINLPENAYFRFAEHEQAIPFTDLKIVKSGNTLSGVPVGVPDKDNFTSDLASLSLLLNDAFGVIQTPSSGQLLKISSENNKGLIAGKVGISTTSFQFSDNYVTFNESVPIYLTRAPGNAETSVLTFSVNDYPETIFGIAGSSGGDLQFKYLAFKAKADRATSSVQQDRISLKTTISTNEITGMTPSVLTLSIGNLVIHPAKIDPITSTSPLAFKLETWNVSAASWNIKQQTSGVNIPQGTIHTGLVDVPATNMLITPDNFAVGEFKLEDMSFSGVIPLNIQNATKSFGYNASTGSDYKGHWELRIVGTGGNPAVTISGLPGMATGASMKFQKFSLLSNGEQDISLGNQQEELTFYEVLKVRPVSFAGGDKYFDMQCNIDLDIPRIDPSMGILRFSRLSGQVKTEVLPFNVSFQGPGGVQFTSSITYGDQKIDNAGYAAIGVIRDTEGINLKGTLHRTAAKAWLEVDPLGQKMPLGTGQTSLANIEGKMEVDHGTNDWNNFVFSGDMTGFKGMENNLRKTFTVYGSITANNENLGVKNIPTSFGGLNITYDIHNARLTADLDINQQVGAIHIQGTTNMLVDPSGWYFLTAGLLTAPGMGTMGAGMLIGDYHQMAPGVTQKLMQYAYNKQVPAAFQTGISGFFFTGQKDVPIVNIPNYEIKLGVINASLGLSVGLDARLWMGFNDNGNEYGIGAMAFAHAWFTASSITCTKLSAEARAELGVNGVYQSNTGVFTATGCGSFSIGGSVRQCIPVPCLSGICCEGCTGISIHEGIKAEILLDSGGNTSIDFDFGSCSGQ